MVGPALSCFSPVDPEAANVMECEKLCVCGGVLVHLRVCACDQPSSHKIKCVIPPGTRSLT